jgi:hypothetical protein
MPLHNWTQVEAGIFHAFHTTWIAEIQNSLNEGVLPPHFYALAEQHAGHFVADVLTLHTPPSPEELAPPSLPGEDGGVAVAEAPPRVANKESVDLTARQLRRSLTIRHISTHRIVAMIEIVSPANKDRLEHVEEFALKTVTALERGIHVLVIDLFPAGPHDPHGMHQEIRRRLLPDQAYEEPTPQTPEEPATLVSYAVGRFLDIYLEHAQFQQPLREMPLFLTAERYVNVPLEPTYLAAWRGMPRFWKDVLEGKPV